MNHMLQAIISQPNRVRKAGIKVVTEATVTALTALMIKKV
jgi:hypothetical protein